MLKSAGARTQPWTWTILTTDTQSSHKWLRKMTIKTYPVVFLTNCTLVYGSLLCAHYVTQFDIVLLTLRAFV